MPPHIDVLLQLSPELKEWPFLFELEEQLLQANLFRGVEYPGWQMIIVY